jgi:hypothetical protein
VGRHQQHLAQLSWIIKVSHDTTGSFVNGLRGDLRGYLWRDLPCSSSFEIITGRQNLVEWTALKGGSWTWFSLELPANVGHL